MRVGRKRSLRDTVKLLFRKFSSLRSKSTYGHKVGERPTTTSRVGSELRLLERNGVSFREGSRGAGFLSGRRDNACHRKPRKGRRTKKIMNILQTIQFAFTSQVRG